MQPGRQSALPDTAAQSPLCGGHWSAPNGPASAPHIITPAEQVFPAPQELAHNPTVLIVNDTMFAHGGVLTGHVQYGLERINAEVAAWMRGDRLIDGSRAPPPFLAMG
jgi:hypothetical protein